jgi:hypothetical protein
LQPKAEEHPEDDGADKDVNIISDGVQTEIERHAKVEMPMTEVRATDAVDIPDEAEIPHQPEV